MSPYLKNSLNLTSKELNEVESRICFGISFQALAPWYPKDFLQYSRRSRGISKSSIFLVLYLEIFDPGVNLFLRFSGQSPLFILYVVISLSYFIRLRTASQSHTQPSLCLVHSISLRALFCSLCRDSSFVSDRHPQMTLQFSDGFQSMLDKQLPIVSGRGCF